MKAPHQKFGKKGEELAANYLQGKGYVIIKCNYINRKREIDIIAQKANLLLFVEVKARANTSFGYPETFVDKKKQCLLQKATEQYMIDYQWDYNIRFDIIAILKKGDDFQITHFEDAF